MFGHTLQAYPSGAAPGAHFGQTLRATPPRPTPQAYAKNAKALSAAPPVAASVARARPEDPDLHMAPCRKLVYKWVEPLVEETTWRNVRKSHRGAHRLKLF